MNDLVDFIGGYPGFNVRGSEVQDFTTGLNDINDKGRNEGPRNDGTLQTSLILVCSSTLRILGG